MSERDFETIHEEHRVLLDRGAPESDPARAALAAELRSLLLSDQGADEGEPLTEEDAEEFRLWVAEQTWGAR